MITENDKKSFDFSGLRRLYDTPGFSRIYAFDNDAITQMVKDMIKLQWLRDNIRQNCTHVTMYTMMDNSDQTRFHHSGGTAANVTSIVKRIIVDNTVDGLIYDLLHNML